MQLPGSDLATLAASLAPLVEIYHPLSPRWPGGSATISPDVLQESTRVFFLQGPPLAALIKNPDMLDPGLAEIKESLKPKLAGPWALRVSFVGHSKESAAYAPQALMGLCNGPLAPEEIRHLVDLVSRCVDQQYSQLQTSDYLNKRLLAESYVAADVSPHDIVHYEISKHYDPGRLRWAYSTLLAHHYRLTLEAKTHEAKLDHVFAGYQTAAAIERPDGYSATTLEHHAFFRKMAASHATELRSLSMKKRSALNFHLLTVEEGFAELHSIVCLRKLADGTISHIRRALPSGKEIRAHMEDRLQQTRVDQSTPYSRGLARYKALYDRHGFAFSFMAKILCEANFKVMGNLLPFHVLSQATEKNFPYHPTALLEKISGFEYTHPNACVKIAAAVPYLQLDARSPQDLAIDMLEQL